jgi:hypothetical protein
MGALQIALLAAQIFGTVEPIVAPFLVAGVKAVVPLAEQGVQALIATIKGKIASKEKMSLSEIHTMALEQHGVDMTKIYRGAGMAGVAAVAASAAAYRASRKRS